MPFKFGVCQMVKSDETECQCMEEGHILNFDDVESKESTATHSYVIHECRTRAINETSKNCGIFCFTLITLILCVVSYGYCQQCLFVLLVVSACLCPFFHPMNAPLWLAIVLLTVGGWNFTVGALTVTWNYKSTG